jgi:hypothetical protein
MDETIRGLNEAIDGLMNREIGAINWDYSPSPEKWSKKEIVGHLIDSAMVNLQRFVRCTYQEGFKLVYDQVEWVEAQRYKYAEIKELLFLWQSLNWQIIRVLKNYPEDRLQVMCDNSKTTQSFHTIEWLAEDYVRHLNHHLIQIYS